MAGENRTLQYREKMDSSSIPNNIILNLTQIEELRYGENPGQAAKFFVESGKKSSFEVIKSGKGGMSATNWLDVCRGYDLLKHFDDSSVAVMKHGVPSGVASEYTDRTSQRDIYVASRNCDIRSAFGSVVAFNKPLTVEAANELSKYFIEAVLAPEFEEGVLGILTKKADIRAIITPNSSNLPKYEEDEDDRIFLTTLPGGLILAQKPYMTGIKTHNDIQNSYEIANSDGHSISLIKSANEEQLKEMEFAWKVNFGVRSNGIVFTKDRKTLAIGTGEQERVGAVEQAIVKAYQKHASLHNIDFNSLNGISDLEKIISPLQGSICSSDAFFPKPDSIETMARVGVAGVIQPGGSKGDYSIVKAINENNMVLGLSDKRCFGHF
ncbi:MAG: hypothetical protein HRU03_00535 [Nanoarchaeales archaeon]|nr:hypothetical protein [Nanoarchaeales archaeon]